MVDQDYNRESNATEAEFVLSPDIPQEERNYFTKWWTLIGHLQALGNIQRHEIHASIMAFDLIADIMRIGDFEWAHEEMAKELMIQQKSRSVEGFQTMYQHGVQKQIIEQTNRDMLGRERRRSWVGRASSVFKNKKEEEVV